MRTRIVFGVPLFILLAASIYCSYLYCCLAALILVGMLLEWYKISDYKIALLFGILLIPLAISSLIILRLSALGWLPSLIYLVLISVTDTTAMISGKLIGGPKLAHNISPNKTWSGLMCASIACAIVAGLSTDFIHQYLVYLEWWQLTIFGSIFAIVEQCSDLLVSFFKRRHGVKDSGNIIPGHGGILDRCDGIILTAPLILWLWVNMSGITI